MNNELYHKLREHIDQYSVGFNASESQAEIEFLQVLFSEEEARMYLHLRRYLQPVPIIAEKAGMAPEAAGEILAGMTQKGLTFPKRKDGAFYYAAAPFMHGLLEHACLLMQDDPKFKEVAKKMQSYLAKEYIPKGRLVRTIPVGGQVNPDLPVAPYYDVINIIKNKDKIAVTPCACEAKTRVIDKSCDQSKEMCISFGFYAELYAETLKIGRYISQDEAIEIIKKAEEEGLVHQLAGDKRSVEGICNCCRDCCGILKSFKYFPKPALMATSDYVVQLDAEECINCQTCIERCPMDAFTEGEDVVSVDPGRCIGCGLCTTTCPSEALSLKIQPEEQRVAPFEPEKYDFIRSTLDFEADIAKYTQG